MGKVAQSYIVTVFKLYIAFQRMTEIRKKDGNFIRNTYDAEGLRAELEENGKLVRFLSSIREKSTESSALERMCSADSPKAAVGSGNNAAEPLYEQLMRDRGIPSTLTSEEKALNRALDLRMQYEGGNGTIRNWNGRCIT